MWQSSIYISKKINKDNLLKKGLEQIDELVFAQGSEGKYDTFDIASKDLEKSKCIKEVHTLITDIILNNIKLDYIMKSIGRYNISNSLCTLISSMLYYDNKREINIVKKHLTKLDKYCIDSIVAFRLRELVADWQELGNIIAGTLSKGYCEKELYSLAQYMIGDRKPTSLFIADSKEILITNVTKGGIVKVPEIYKDKLHNIINAIVKYGASEVVIERKNADKELLSALRNIVDVKIL